MKASVIIVTKNEGKYIKSLLEALSGQTYREFEIIIVDNGSVDETEEIIRSFKDSRVKYFFNPQNCGFSQLRNLGINRSCADFVFFTDGDCIPNEYWLEEGLKVLETGKYVGVEGKTYYESQKEITVSDYNTHQLVPGRFMTCNIAYKRSILEKANYFDPVFKYGHEDRDMAFRVLKFGEIYFSPQMLVFHQKKRLTIGALFNRAKMASNAVDFIKRHNSFPSLKKNILYPERLLIIFFPFILIFAVNYRTFYDFKIGLFKYISYIYERLLIWKSAIKNRIFVI